MISYTASWIGLSIFVAIDETKKIGCKNIFRTLITFTKIPPYESIYVTLEKWE
jgi:hypothetical protein